MSSNRRGLGFWIYVWFPVLLAIGVIAIESQDFMGADFTSGPLRLLFQAIFGHVSDASWELTHHYLRKCGHFFFYGFMGLAWLRAWWLTLPRSHFLPDALLALLGTALVASCDEWHQSYLPNRTGTPWDVLLDCTGAIVLQVIVYVFMRILKPKRLARAA
jgi:VanZ family protein